MNHAVIHTYWHGEGWGAECKVCGLEGFGNERDKAIDALRREPCQGRRPNQLRNAEICEADADLKECKLVADLAAWAQKWGRKLVDHVVYGE